MAVRYADPEPLAARATSMAARHVGGSPGLINEHQPLGVEIELAVEPGLPPREAIHRVLMFHADASSGAAGKRGCLLAGSAMVLGTFEADVVQRVNTGFRKIETLVAALIRAGQKDGSISKRVDGEATARLMLCAMQGMRVIGKTGRTRAQMRQTADLAMKLLD